MARIRPKTHKNSIEINNKTIGKGVKYNYSKEILHNAPIFPKPLEYEDIDIAFKKFVEDELCLTCEDKVVPTFTLYSNQRFSEYSQTWRHTDSEGNLLMNFKTIIRDKNPKMGTNQGHLWNIPGNRNYTLLMREVVDDNGIECYEIYSMKQPYTVDLQYRVSFMTNKFEKINEFNQLLNKIFCARQHYIRPNGHYIPMVIDDISDDTEYNVENRKFYIQSCEIKVMAYIISEKDFSVIKKPKHINLIDADSIKNKKSLVEIEEEDIVNDVEKYKSIILTVDFKEYEYKTKFIMDTVIEITDVSLENIRTFKIWINDVPYYTEKGFKINENDEVLIKIKTFEESNKSRIIFRGINKDFIHNDVIPENVSNEKNYKEIINID